MLLLMSSGRERTVEGGRDGAEQTAKYETVCFVALDLHAREQTEDYCNQVVAETVQTPADPDTVSVDWQTFCTVKGQS
jgi:hypothetical protein